MSCDAIDFGLVSRHYIEKNIQLLKKYLYIHGKYANIQGKRCSILVGVAIFQEGPKNPLKGTSMKSLVFACYAQFRVDAGG